MLPEDSLAHLLAHQPASEQTMVVPGTPVDNIYNTTEAISRFKGRG